MNHGATKASVSRLFYAGNNVLVCQVGSHNTRLMYGNNHLVAQAQTTAALLQTLVPNTVIAAWGAECTHVQIYTPYGFSRVDTMLTSAAYAGAWRDSASGNYSLGAGRRFMSPVLQRFLSPDDFSPFGSGGVNAYAYCEGDPINNFDPSGRAKEQIRMASASLRKKQVDVIFNPKEHPNISVLRDYLEDPEPASLGMSSSRSGLRSLRFGYRSDFINFRPISFEVNYDDRLSIHGYKLDRNFNNEKVPRLVLKGVWVPMDGMSEQRKVEFLSQGFEPEGDSILRNRFIKIQAAVVQVRDSGKNDKKTN